MCISKNQSEIENGEERLSQVTLLGLRRRTILAVLLLEAFRRSPLTTICLPGVTVISLCVRSIALLLTTAVGTTCVAPIRSVSRATVTPLLWPFGALSLAGWFSFGTKFVLWARYILRGVVGIELLVDGLWNRCNFGAKFLLNLVQIEAILPIDQVYGYPQMSITSRSTNTMKICLRILRKVKIDHHIDGLNIDSTSQKIRTDKVAAYAVAKIMEYPITVVLQHLSMRVEAGVPQLSDFLSQQFDAVRRIAEDNGLVYLQFREESVEAVHFLLFLYETVVLSYSSERKLIHEVNFVRIFHMFVLETMSKSP